MPSYPYAPVFGILVILLLVLILLASTGHLRF